MNVRLPDVQFGKPDEKASGFRIVRISNVRDLLYRPDFRSIQLPEHPITGHLCPDFRQIGAETGSKPVLALASTKTGSKPVWNRFWSIQLPERLKSGHKCPDFRRPVLKRPV